MPEPTVKEAFDELTESTAVLHALLSAPEQGISLWHVAVYRAATRQLSALAALGCTTAAAKS